MAKKYEYESYNIYVCIFKKVRELGKNICNKLKKVLYVLYTWSKVEFFLLLFFFLKKNKNQKGGVKVGGKKAFEKKRQTDRQTKRQIDRDRKRKFEGE